MLSIMNFTSFLLEEFWEWQSKSGRGSKESIFYKSFMEEFNDENLIFVYESYLKFA